MPYDVIIVGVGSAGCVLAARGNPGWSFAEVLPFFR